MPLRVTERQTRKTWYELSGELEASTVFPKLLPDSKSVKDVDIETTTEPTEDEGYYDGFKADEMEMPDEITEFTESAVLEFHDEALASATAMLNALEDGQTLFRGEFEDEEQNILEEAAKELGIDIPWNKAEAARIAEEEAQYIFAREEEKRHEEGKKKVIEEAKELFMSGKSHSAVRSIFPDFSGEIANLVGALRSEGMQISR